MKTYKRVFTLTLFISFLSLLFTAHVHASDTGEIYGMVISGETGAPLAGVNIKVLNDANISGTTTDASGFYSLKPLRSGNYDLQFSFLGLQTKQVKNIQVAPGQMVDLDVTLGEGNIMLDPVEVVIVSIPLLEKSQPHIQTYDDSILKKLPIRRADDQLAQSNGVFQADIGDPIYVRGARAGSVTYIVDGMRYDEAPNLPGGAINRMSVITGGIPAKYGDTTGGVIVITTKSYYDF